MVHSSSHYYYDPLELETGQDVANLLQDERHNECNRIEWPLMSDDLNWMRRSIVIVSYIVLALAALNIIAIVGILVYLLVNSNTSTDSEFSLYKNTRFKDCAAVDPDASNCSTILAAWTKKSGSSLGAYYADQGRFYIPGTEVTAENRVSYDWCQTVSCFNDYTVIPSSANDSAMGITALSGWWYVIVSAWSTIWTLRKVSPWFHPNSKTKPCRGWRELGIIDWVLFLYHLCGPIIGWWVSFADSIINPVPWPTLSLIAWLTTWGYSSQIQYHPYSCIFARVPRIPQALPWIFGLLAVLQCAATFYSAETDETMSGGTKKIYDSYTCLAAQIATTLGTSTCSAEEICSKDWLFSAPYFEMPGDIGKGLPFGLCVTALVMAITVPVGILMTKISTSIKISFKRYYKMWSPLLCLSFLAIITILVVVFMNAIDFGKSWNRRKADALVAYDVECRVVHVALSPWRFYLDVNRYGRALRVVRLWFAWYGLQVCLFAKPALSIVIVALILLEVSVIMALQFLSTLLVSGFGNGAFTGTSNMTNVPILNGAVVYPTQAWWSIPPAAGWTFAEESEAFVTG
ncbi:uncharacterized protein TRUGW13939_08718 [Talaromyces rugulosus]|uniref:Uncharacterized protein n=1 Tax=Talaromyces rugulosus TaxID=121627 RepID=A0A7H8R5V3_TALRU|nr:uncharacterized protein TRUGW13939_08718 [Talaromyces rugulosus]QKX61566.1 hypothetical protein TRUGW13939_08718 [Talaromyces rugulosus]